MIESTIGQGKGSDLISRQAAINEIKEIYEWHDNVTKERIIEHFERLPSAQTKTGRWEMKPDPYGFFDEIPVCSECGCTTKMRETYKYCPNCGAKMGCEQR